LPLINQKREEEIRKKEMHEKSKGAASPYIEPLDIWVRSFWIVLINGWGACRWVVDSSKK
jgi:hypothetical protein